MLISAAAVAKNTVGQRKLLAATGPLYPLSTQLIFQNVENSIDFCTLAFADD